MEKINLNDFKLDEIESIELIGEEETIDISVEDTEMFYGNEIYTHNSSIAAQTVDSSMIGGSIKKGQIGHFIVSVAKTLEQKENGMANMAILKSRFGLDGIVFEEIIFNNATIQIDIGDGKGNFTTQLEVKEKKDEKRLDKMQNLMDVVSDKIMPSEAFDTIVSEKFLDDAVLNEGNNELDRDVDTDSDDNNNNK